MKTLCKVIKYNPITIIMMISAILVFGIRISIMSVLATITMLTIARIMDLDIRDMYKKYLIPSLNDDDKIWVLSI